MSTKTALEELRARAAAEAELANRYQEMRAALEAQHRDTEELIEEAYADFSVEDHKSDPESIKKLWEYAFSYKAPADAWKRWVQSLSPLFSDSAYIDGLGKHPSYHSARIKITPKKKGKTSLLATDQIPVLELVALIRDTIGVDEVEFVIDYQGQSGYFWSQFRLVVQADDYSAKIVSVPSGKTVQFANVHEALQHIERNTIEGKTRKQMMTISN